MGESCKGCKGLGDMQWEPKKKRCKPVFSNLADIRVIWGAFLNLN